METILNSNNFWRACILVIIVGCYQDSSNGKITNSGHFHSKLSNSIIGDWKLCTTVTGTITVSGNICPTITFMPNYVGIDIIKMDTFLWKLNDSKLLIKYLRIDKSNRFRDSIYHCSIIEKDTLNLKMSLLGLDSSIHYYFYKSTRN